MKIRKSECMPTLIALGVCFFGAAGTIFYKFSGPSILFIELLFALVLFLGWYQSGNVGLAPKIIIFSVILSFFVLNNNAFLSDLNSLPHVLLNIIGLNFIWISRYQNSSWISKYFSIARSVYLFYAGYTILMYFIPALLEIPIAIFPSGAESLRLEYNSGCMPGFTNHYSTNGMLLACGLIISGSYYIACENSKLKNILLFVVFTVAILFTGKRAHIIFGLAAVFVGYYVYMSDKKKSRLMNSVGILLMGLVAIFIIINYIPALSMVFNRFLETAEAGDVTLGRTKMWAAALKFFKSNAVFGIGWEQIRHRTIWQLNIHNIYIQLLAETGITGFLFFVSFFIYILVRSIRLLSQMKMNNECENWCQAMVFSVSMQVFFLLYGFTGNPLYDKEMYFPYYIACAVYLCCRYMLSVEEKYD